MSKIKAAVCHQFTEPLQIETVVLRSPLPKEIEVQLGAVAICHSDIAFAEGLWSGVLPAVYGHEAAGVVTEVGTSVRGISVGDRVVVTLIRACGHCLSCAAGQPTSCEMPQDASASPLQDQGEQTLHQGMACGAFAEKVVVDASQVVQIPAALPFEVACLLACSVITGVGAVVHSAQLRAGQDVVVIGAGGVGLNAIQGARIAGARRIVAVDRIRQKLEIAQEFGATDVVLATDPEPWKLARQVLGRGADAIFITVGAAAAYETAPRYLAPTGKLVMVGMPRSCDFASYDPGTMASLNQGMIGSKMGNVVIQRDIPWIVDLYQQGRLKLDELVSGRWRLEQINEAIADTKSGNARRNVIVFD